MMSFELNLYIDSIIMSDIWHGVAGGMAGIAVDLVFYPL